MTTATRTSTGSDIVRQTVVIAATTFMIIAALFGVGLLGGTPVEDLQGGDLSAEATVLAPASSAFSIWSVIYLFMIAYTVWQALPSQRASERQRKVGYLIALSAVFNGAWLLAAQFVTLFATVAAIVLLLITLAAAMRVLVLNPPRTALESLLTDVTVGLHLGWVSLATVANSTAWLAADVVPAEAGEQAEVWGIMVLLVVAVIGAAIAIGTRGRLAPGLAMAWGLTWIGVGRTAGEPVAEPVAYAAWAAAAVVLLVPIILWIRGRRGELDLDRR